MTTPIPDEGLEVAKSALKLRVKAQLRLGLGSLAGVLIGRHIVPAGWLDDGMLDIIAGLIFGVVAVYWQDARAWLQHSRLWQLANNKRVPDDVIRPVAPPSDGTEPQA